MATQQQQDTQAWRDRALAAERKLIEIREVLLDVDAVINMRGRAAQVLVDRIRRDPRPIHSRVEEALLDTAVPTPGAIHCRNWAWGCMPGESYGCGCRCERCKE